MEMERNSQQQHEEVLQMMKQHISKAMENIRTCLKDDGNRCEPKGQQQQLFKDIFGEYRQVNK